MGLLDLPAPVLSWADSVLAALLPPLARIMVWGEVAAAVSMGLYRLTATRRRMARIAAEERRIKITLADESLAIADGLVLVRRLLRLAVSRIGLLLPTVLVAALPVIYLMNWLDTRYGHDPPSGETVVRVTVQPASFQGRWIFGEDAVPRIELLNEHGSVLHSLPISAPGAVIDKRTWWTALVGNSLHYLPPDSPIERVEVELPEKQYFAVGPDWIRGWTTPFMATLVLGSLLLKVLLRTR